MSQHWSGVVVGEYFDIIFAYDGALFVQSEVVVPFCRSPPDGFPSCMLPEVTYAVKSIASDSEYHVRKALRFLIVVR